MKIWLIIFFLFHVWDLLAEQNSTNKIVIENNIDPSFQKVKTLKLIIESDSVFYSYSQSKPQPAMVKLIRKIQQGNFKYIANRIWIQIRIVFHRFVLWLNGEKKPHSLAKLFQINNYQIDFTTNLPAGSCPIKDPDNQVLGHFFWIEESRVNLEYLYNDNFLSADIDSVKQCCDLFCLTSATFFDARQKPVGFQVNHGKCIQPNFNENWDGLVMIDSGRMFVANIKTKEVINMATNANGCYPESGSYIANFRDKQLSTIQLPLLIFNNQILVDENTAPYKLREMRLLCGVKFWNSSNQYITIIDFQKPEYLPNMVYSLFQTMHAHECNLLFSVLLDVGSNNLFMIYNPNNQLNNNFKGLIPVEKATNALLFLQNKPE